ncbi:MAG: glycosyltransferase family 87 protein [Candidatus Cybelea sp.]
MIPQPYRRLVLALMLLALGVAAVRDFSRLGAALPWRTMDEFADFYCAGLAFDRGASPYTYEPLHACEHQFNTGRSFRGKLFAANPAIAVPAPQPPYDFVPFVALARANYSASRAIDAVAIVLAVALSAIALTAIGMPLALSLAVFALSTGYVELNTAQIAPFALLALVLCGLALERDRDRLAGVLAALTAIEPIVGLPVVVATFLFVPRARWALAAALAVLFAFACAIGGPKNFLEYLVAVLPAHSQSELLFPFQYSLTSALAILGIAPTVARAAGAASYVLLLAVALVIAPRTSAQLRRRALIVFVPALCCVIGGTFLHQEELCFAIPAVTLLAWETTGRRRTIATAALCLLAVPWIAVWGAKQLFLASLLVVATILLKLRLELRASLITFCAIAAGIYCFELAPPRLPVPASMPAIYAATQLVSLEWRDYTALRSTHDPLWFAIKVPTWGALLASLAIAASISRRI